MSDGEAFEPVEEVAAAAAEAAKANVALVTVGFGTEAGATIPVREANTVREKRDTDGNVVLTRHNPATLRAAAEAARGTFVPADAPTRRRASAPRSPGSGGAAAPWTRDAT
jgi:Ca-activated chloride channel family protein